MDSNINYSNTGVENESKCIAKPVLKNTCNCDIQHIIEYCIRCWNSFDITSEDVCSECSYHNICEYCMKKCTCGCEKRFCVECYWKLKNECCDICNCVYMIKKRDTKFGNLKLCVNCMHKLQNECASDGTKLTFSSDPYSEGDNIMCEMWD